LNYLTKLHFYTKKVFLSHCSHQALNQECKCACYILGNVSFWATCRHCGECMDGDWL